MIDLLLHIIGFCGDTHPKLIEMLPYYQTILEVPNTLRVYVSKLILTHFKFI